MRLLCRSCIAVYYMSDHKLQCMVVKRQHVMDTQHAHFWMHAGIWVFWCVQESERQTEHDRDNHSGRKDWQKKKCWNTQTEWWVEREYEMLGPWQCVCSVDLIWVTLCDRKLAEELRYWRSRWKLLAHTHAQTNIHISVRSQKLLINPQTTNWSSD